MTISVHKALKNLSSGSMDFDRLSRYMDGSPNWTDYLMPRDYKRILSMIDRNDTSAIVEFATSILPLYTKIWNLYDRPFNNKEWEDAWLSGSRDTYTLTIKGGSVYHYEGRNPGDAILNALNHDSTLEIVGWIDPDTGEFKSFD